MAQIVDDSTHLVYGPTSTRYILMEDMKHSDTLYHVMDTSIHNMENFETHRKSTVDYQDLGNNGTALKPKYYSIPTTIGRTTGFYAYDPYVKSAEEFKYYDSKSPFINLEVDFGGKGRPQVDFSFSRNINPQWNVGFDVNHVSSEKQIGTSSLRENQVKTTGIDVYTFYRSINRKYQMMFHVYRIDQTILETGGIETTTEEKDYYQYLDANIYLTNAQSFDKRTRLFLYHQYSLKPFFELYNSIERSNVVNKYTDTPLTDDSFDYYDQILIRTDSTLDASSMKQTKIEAGIKGRIAQRIFYSAYVKRRDLDYRYRFLELDHVGENYLGGDIKIHITPTNTLGGQAEVMDAGNYYFRGFFNNKYLKASYTSSLSAPSFLSESYFGNHYEWYNSFNSTFANSIKGSLYYALPFLSLEPEVDLSTVDEYIYFGYDKTPKQESNPILINKYSVKANLTFIKHMHLDNRLVWNNVSGQGANAMRIPDWNYFGKLYYKDIVFNDFMEFELGFDLRWQSAYYAKAYDPITQQFHLQDDFELPSYFTSDLFFVMKANNLTLFFNWEYLNQGRDKGYFATPYYPGQRRAIDLGIRWMFFD
ncbi:putative porin [Reichenbachiella agarivorans]|uniref:Porin n=1 Tax=Reichenbachiella agarivorans TaxID=2979464 RepID=A0ABY6CRH8_9BACT|nr:putative porin [Reichenbachiella agarivorans]UXP32444.1 putative porin [Reichenbachiella agarivorans]